MSSPKCLVRGSINIDEFFQLPHIVRPGETISSTSLTKKAGGKGANQAYALAKAGGGVVLDGCIGEDGVWVRKMLEGVGVGVERVRVVENEVTGRAIIQSAADGENSIVLHAGANYHIPPTDTPPQLTTFTHLLLQNEIPLTSTLSYLTTASSLSITSTFNPSPMLTRTQLREFPWSSLSWLIVNEGELSDLLHAFDISTSTSTDLRNKAEEELLALHGSEGFSDKVSIICTLGAQGILYFQPGKAVRHLPSAKLDRPLKDTTGAGDCFAGYFVAGLMRGLELEEVLRTCLTACAICVESAGAMESVPSHEEVLARMKA